MSDQHWDRKVRLGQVVAPFGVGAVYDFRGESLIGCDTKLWNKSAVIAVRAPRLAAALGVKGLRTPKSVASAFQKAPWTIPYQRFPRWLFCPRCRRLSRVDGWDGGPARCSRCEGAPQLVPMRFVVVCEDGHLGDFPWARWAHKDLPPGHSCKIEDRLMFETSRSGGTGLETLVVRCEACGASSTLEGITGEASLKRIGLSCPGRQPWEQTRTECKKPARVVQRGASNVYFAETVSALEIPDGAPVGAGIDEQIAAEPDFTDLLDANGAVEEYLAGKIAKNLGIEVAEVMRVVEAHRAPAASVSTSDPDPIKDPEWRAFMQPPASESPDFVIRETALAEPMATTDAVITSLETVVDRIVLATRLREVRALTGFRRYQPDGRLVRPDLGDMAPEWLPAIEVYGEGILITLDEDALQKWEQRPEVVKRAERLAQKAQGSLMESRLPMRISPRFLALHTLAHLLVRRLAFDCGYAAASLRERIYCREPAGGAGPQAGVLVYTAAGDVEGTLGGLVRQGEAPRLVETLLAALDDAKWCSADPICAESAGQGFDGLNLAACHACALLAETSCDHGNVGLDRVMLIGGEDGVPGLFAAVLEEAITATVEATSG